MLQKDVFLSGEANQWFDRNTSSANDLSRDYLIHFLEALPLPRTSDVNVLEVGCGHGSRLLYLRDKLNWSVCGLDPSTSAVDSLQERGINCIHGTADNLPFSNNSFDILIFGFCLYVCDSTDLFRISSEAHRVLKSNSWLAIIDFWSPSVSYNTYVHADNVKSRKLDYTSMFTCHPDYILTDHSIRHHSDFSYTDLNDEWISASIVRRSIR